MSKLFAFLAIAFSMLCAVPAFGAAPPPADQHLLYVATPGIRDYLEWGGHGVIVFDIDHGHRFVRRIPTAGVDVNGKPLNVKGICASAATGKLYVSTIRDLQCIDLLTDKSLWVKSYAGGCDRMEVSPDGKTIYLPSLEGAFWNVIDASNGNPIARITTNSGSHNTIFAPDGREVYLAGLHSPELSIADAATNKVVRTVGRFRAPIRPFCINSEETRVYVNVNGLLGFQIGDLKTGQVLGTVHVDGVAEGPTKRHGCPSHGIGMTLDEKEIWVADGHNSMMHVYDITADPPKRVASILLRDQPGWVTFSLDGKYAYPSSGDIVDTATKKIIGELTDEHGGQVGSEKLLEIDFANGKPVRAGNQFGIGSRTGLP